jgi:hypothetical protein
LLLHCRLSQRHPDLHCFQHWATCPCCCWRPKASLHYCCHLVHHCRCQWAQTQREGHCLPPHCWPTTSRSRSCTASRLGFQTSAVAVLQSCQLWWGCRGPP